MDCLNPDIKILLSLLRAGLWECEPDDLTIFPLDRNTWKRIYQLSFQQTVTGLVYRGMCRLPDNYLPPVDLLAKWVARIDAIECYNQKMNAVLGELMSVFEAEGVKPVLQKGQGIASLYAYPLLRQCGDIDLYFYDTRQWHKASECIKNLGIMPIYSADGGLHYSWKGVIVEHHIHLFDIVSPWKQKTLKELENKFGYVSSSSIIKGNTEILLPAPVLNMLLLNAHILKHFLGRGIGLRQLCDLARTYGCWKDEVQKVDMKMIYDKLGMLDWNEVLHGFLTEYLGLPSMDLPYQSSNYRHPYVLMERVLEGGNFGQFGIESTVDDVTWKRKVHTMWAFGKHLKKSCALCPEEAIWTILKLMKGQLA